MNPASGVLADAVQLKPGKSFYTIEAIEKDRLLKEEEKMGNEGPFTEHTINFDVAGNSAELLLQINPTRFHRYGVIVKDRDGMQRLLGDEDSGCRLTSNYSSGDIEGTRKWSCSFSWQSQQNAPVYTTAAFTISVGGSSYTVGTLTLVARFVVGDPGAITDIDTTFTHALLANKKALYLVDGVALLVDDSSGSIDWTLPQNAIKRRIEKTDASTVITFVHGVVTGETHEIYAY